MACEVPRAIPWTLFGLSQTISWIRQTGGSQQIGVVGSGPPKPRLEGLIGAVVVGFKVGWDPQMYSLPNRDTAADTEEAEICVQGGRSGMLDGSPEHWIRDLSKPSRPLALLPQENTLPVSVRASVCCEPAATFVINVPIRDSTTLGGSGRFVGGPMPSWPCLERVKIDKLSSATPFASYI